MVIIVKKKKNDDGNTKVIIINSLFQPGDFSAKSATVIYA